MLNKNKITLFISEEKIHLPNEKEELKLETLKKKILFLLQQVKHHENEKKELIKVYS
jgi:hypothetical protein